MTLGCKAAAIGRGIFRDQWSRFYIAAYRPWVSMYFSTARGAR